jgi:hypothetical protein
VDSQTFVKYAKSYLDDPVGVHLTQEHLLTACEAMYFAGYVDAAISLTTASLKSKASNQELCKTIATWITNHPKLHDMSPVGMIYLAIPGHCA